jgi:hypothetical protein
LDRALARGQDPWTTAEATMRAAELTALPTRRTLARAVADLLVIADLPGPAWPTIEFADVQRQPIREEHDRLAELAYRIHAPAPVPVACIARLATLLWHDGDGLRDPSQAAGMLRETLDGCFDAIEPATPVAVGGDGTGSDR